jgi:hypothetical protein
LYVIWLRAHLNGVYERRKKSWRASVRSKVINALEGDGEEKTYGVGSIIHSDLKGQIEMTAAVVSPLYKECVDKPSSPTKPIPMSESLKTVTDNNVRQDEVLMNYGCVHQF